MTYAYYIHFIISIPVIISLYFIIKVLLIPPTLTIMNWETQEDDEITFIGTLSDWFNWTSEKSKNGIESFHKMTALPWWTTITGITIGARIIVLPLRVRAWKNGRLMKLTTEYCNKFEAPKLREYHQKNTLPDKRNELYKNDMMRVHAETMKSIGVSPWKSLSPIPVSIPLFLSLAAGLRGIDFEGEGVISGVIWKNLGEAELLSAVPVAISNFFFIEYTRRHQKMQQQQINNGKGDERSFMKKTLPFIIGHSINLCSFVVLTRVASAVNLFLLTSSIMSIMESVLLKGREAGNNKSDKSDDKSIYGLLDRWTESEFKRLIEKNNFNKVN